MSKKIKDENGNVYVQKRPFYKRVWFWLLVIILVLVGISSAGNSTKSPDSSFSNSNENSSNSQTSHQSGTKINKSNFDHIQLSESNGTSKTEVEKMFGQKPKSSSTQTIQGLQAEQSIWTGGLLGSTVTVGFYNDHAVSKGIAGLTGSSRISSKQYNAIQNGMTRDQVLNTLGKPYGRSYTLISGQSAEILEYQGKGSLGANMNVTLTNGTVSGKAQVGIDN